MNFRIYCLISLATCLSLTLNGQGFFENRGIGGGGALFSPAINPHQPEELFMSCDMTELFHSTNGGKNWAFYPSRELTAFQNSKVQFTADPLISYVLGMQFREEHTFPYRSLDGGDTWGPITDPTGGAALYLFADPHHTQRLYVSTWGAIFYSDNGGQSWNLAYQDPNNNLHLAGVFWDGTTSYVGTNYGLLVSTNAGATLSLDGNPGLPVNTGFSSFAGARDGNILTLYGVGLHVADLYPTVQAWEYSGYQGVFRRQMDDNAGPWESIAPNLPAGTGLYQIAMSATDPAIAYVAGTNGSTSYPVVYKTMDSGNTWTSVFQAVDNANITTGWSGFQGDEDWYYGEYALGLAVSAADPDQVVLTDLGFCHRSTDGGQSWRQTYVKEGGENPAGSPTPTLQVYQGNGLENTSGWWMHWVDPDQIFAAFTDIGGIYSADKGQSWSFDRLDRSLNSTYQIVEGVDGTLYAATSSVHDLYQSTYLTDGNINGGTGRILYSVDQGMHWEVLHHFNNPVVSVALDPNDPEVLYAGVVNSLSGGIYKTSNLSDGSASIWTHLPNPPRTEGHPLSIWVLEDGAVACSFSGRRTSNFTASSGVFYSTDGGNSWEDRSHPDMYYWTKDLVIDPHDAQQNTWYAAVFSGWGGAANDKGGLFRSTDRGASWENILDLFRVESIGIHPELPQAYVSTEDEGLWFTDQLDEPAPTFNELESYTFLHPLRIFFDPYDPASVWVTSFGNGLSVANFPVGTTEQEEAGHLLVFPNPSNGDCYLELPGGGELELFTMHGELVWKQRVPMHHAPRTWELDFRSMPAGAYWLRWQNEQNVRYSKLILHR